VPPRQPHSDYDKKGLLDQAQMWDAQATVLAGFTTEANSMTIDADGGIAFGECVNLYNQCLQEISSWTGQGGTIMQEITSALAQAARTYGASEDEIDAAIKNVGGRGISE